MFEQADAHLLEHAEIRAACLFARMRSTLVEHLIPFQALVNRGNA